MGYFYNRLSTWITIIVRRYLAVILLLRNLTLKP